MTFDELGLSPKIVQAVTEQGYTTPTPIQAQAITPVLHGKDVMAAAQTGTGKTAGFTLPMIERLMNATSPRPKGNYARALVLTPTRELAAQVADSITQYSRNVPIKSRVVFGGVKINPQMQALRGGVDILVATPGRLLDLCNQNAIKLDKIELFVLDEADRMLDMGFIHDIRKVIDRLPKVRQNLLFSATFSQPIRDLAKTIVNNPVEITVNPPNSTATRIKQWLHPVDKKAKPELLIHLIKKHKWQQVLVFSRTKHGANKLVKQLDAAGLKASAIHGNKSQGARTRALAEFKSGEINILVATDIAARGIDIDQLEQVINVDLPQVAEDYVHRIGRTGRAGAQGCAMSLVAADEYDMLQAIERLIKKTIPREFVDGFEPNHMLPESRLDTRQPKKKRPKKPKATRDSATPFTGKKTTPNAPNKKRPAKTHTKKAGPKSTQKTQTKRASTGKASSSTRSTPKNTTRRPSRSN